MDVIYKEADPLSNTGARAARPDGIFLLNHKPSHEPKTMLMAGSGWIWLGLAGSGWVWLGPSGSGWVRVGLAGSGWIWLDLAGSRLGTPFRSYPLNK